VARRENARSFIRPVNVAKPEKEDSDEDSCGVRGAEDDAEHGRRWTSKVQDPRTPSPEEREEHMKTHLPYRSWCRRCARGRAKQSPHRKSDDHPRGPEKHFDFCFLVKEDEPFKTISVLVVKDRGSRLLMASNAPSKSTGTFIAKRAMAFIRD
jgi:hypothetical protein